MNLHWCRKLKKTDRYELDSAEIIRIQDHTFFDQETKDRLISKIKKRMRG